MIKTFSSEQELEVFAKSLGESALKSLKSSSGPVVFELIGDVGAGKTTFTRALARGLGVTSPVTSPSFSVSNRYSFPLFSMKPESSSALIKSPSPNPEPSSASEKPLKAPSFGTLIHYDFYRLDDPGIMRFELEEALSDSSAVIVIEWGKDLSSLLPASRTKITFKILSEFERELEIIS
ncbi:tRNA (adenosine(37)-N6)-threonylcarbamoyltransferase complex ATPase subunit type 1 TsaE [Candidatus Saccharibacteria bacterium]|nr:tRNA (adenosine(37)-N6)-threonylcarbamoyltransferase complex ATPase subunit type 1 TsaE [Candidatus Saccharibacteria bacterium]